MKNTIRISLLFAGIISANLSALELLVNDKKAESTDLKEKSNQEFPKLDIFAIPGQNGLGSEPFYIRDILEVIDEITQVTTPSSMPDLGQDSCLSHLRDAVNKNISEKILIHATSQGTATALNYLAHEDKGKRIKAMILEAVLISGNRAIEHTLKGPLMKMETVVNLPFSYYWISYIAKALFPKYWPAGKQPIKSINKIPTDIPIIIVHSKQDPQLSYDNACALYYALKSFGNNNVYLISKNGMNHIRVLSEMNDKEIIQNILIKHKLLKNPLRQVKAMDLSIFQPDHKQFEKLYNDVISKERIHEYIAKTVKFGSLCLLAKYLYKKFNLKPSLVLKNISSTL